jgi:methylated-DNA-protein-cysteine methyltransferase-like protein
MDNAFAEIYDIVRRIPAGAVMSYGQVGSLCGAVARTVGWAMSVAPDGVPWHRVVGADGYLRIGRRSPELQQLQRDLLLAEEIEVVDGYVDMERYRIVI